MAEEGELEDGDWGEEFGEEGDVGTWSVEPGASGGEIHQNHFKRLEIRYLRS